jgi:WD40 repeat protein
MTHDMITATYSYKVGGGLRFNHPTYIQRQADQALYQALRAGEFCYVFSSRQMGKSSLRVQIMHRLQRVGVVTASIDLTTIGSEVVTAEQWYRGIFSELVRKFHFSDRADLTRWWTELESLSPVQRLSRFIEEIVLVRLADRQIVICLDEIDSLLSLQFSTDDFFAWIRSCYNQRAEAPDYNRLTFALFGVATPSDLMRDKQRTPFNIGRAIELYGFQPDEAQLLVQGLVGNAENPQAVLYHILNWTGGQPFLTQKLCQLVLMQPSPVTTGHEADRVDHLVRSQIIHNWELEDEPEHLRTIRNYILRDSQRAGRLLGLYQQILSATPDIDDSDEQRELLLSGLVIKQNGRLVVSNRIYQEIFDRHWVQRQLSNLRPYSEALEAWVESGYQDESRLLQKQALRDAQTWSLGKRLSDLDYQFLAASQLLDRRMIEHELEAERQAKELAEQANQILSTAQQQAKQTIRRGLIGLTVVSVCAAGLLGLAGFLATQAAEQRRQATLSKIDTWATSSEVLHVSNQGLDALIAGLRAAIELQKRGSGEPTDLRQRVQTSLQQAINFVAESNRLDGHTAGVNQVRFSPDGQLIASVSSDKTTRIWRRDGQLLHTLNHASEVNSVDFSPDGETIATASSDGTVKLWDINGQLRSSQPDHTAAINQIRFSPNGETVATASSDGTVKLWNVNGQLLHTLHGHTGAVYSVSFSPDGQLIATAGEDATVILWNHKGERLQTLTGHSKGIRAVTFSPDGQTIASAGEDNVIKLWSREGQLLHSLDGHTNWIYSISFSPDGQTIATASADMTIKLWHSDGHLLRTLAGHSDDVLDVSFSPDSQTLASASLDNSIKLWKPNSQPALVLAGHQDWVGFARFSPDGQTIATASLDGTAKLWSRDGHLLHTLVGHSGPVYSVSFSPDGQLIATTGGDKTVRLWSRTGRLLRTLTGHQDWVAPVSFSPDGRLLASAGGDKTVILWNRNGQRIGTLSGHQDWIYDLAFSPDGETIATASKDKTVKLWSHDGRLLHTLTGHTDQVYSVSFSPDGNTIISASGDKTVKFWNRNGQLLRTLPASEKGVLAESVSPSGRLLATAGEDQLVQLWDRNHHLIDILSGHHNGIWSVAFSPDGQRLVTASQDHTAIVWNLQAVGNLNHLITKACQWSDEYLRTNVTISEGDRTLCAETLKQNADNAR